MEIFTNQDKKSVTKNRCYFQKELRMYRKDQKIFKIKIILEVEKNLNSHNYSYKI